MLTKLKTISLINMVDGLDGPKETSLNHVYALILANDAYKETCG